MGSSVLGPWVPTINYHMSSYRQLLYHYFPHNNRPNSLWCSPPLRVLWLLWPLGNGGYSDFSSSFPDPWPWVPIGLDTNTDIDLLSRWTTYATGSPLFTTGPRRVGPPVTRRLRCVGEEGGWLRTTTERDKFELVLGLLFPWVTVLSLPATGRYVSSHLFPSSTKISPFTVNVVRRNSVCTLFGIGVLFRHYVFYSVLLSLTISVIQVQFLHYIESLLGIFFPYEKTQPGNSYSFLI